MTSGQITDHTDDLKSEKERENESMIQNLQNYNRWRN